MCAGARLRVLTGMSRLSEINLKGCYKVADMGMAALAYLTSLLVLNLQECWQITANGLARLSGACGKVPCISGSAMDSGPGLSMILEINALAPGCCTADRG